MNTGRVSSAMVIGCGLVGAKRALALNALSVPVITVSDPDVARAEELADRLEPRPHVCTDAERARASGAADLAVIATPHDALASSALSALDAGCHVLLEKPGGIDRAQLASVRASAHRAGRLVRVGYNHRFHPAVLAAKALVDAGAFGDVLSVRMRYGHGGRLGYESEWRADPSRGGGELLDQASHLVDLVRFLAGDVELAFSELRTDFWEMAVEDNAYMALRLVRGGFAWMHASWTEWKNLFAVEIALRRARIDILGLGGSYGTERLVVHAMRPELGPPDTTEQSYPLPDDSWKAEIEDVLSEIGGGDSIGAGIDDGLAVLSVLDAARAH